MRSLPPSESGPTSPDDYKKVPAYIDRKQCLRALGASEMALRNWETRPDDPLPRYKNGRKIYYEIQELFTWYYRFKLAKEFGPGGVDGLERHSPNAPKKPPPKNAGVNAEKQRLVKAQADAQEIKNELARAELAPIQLLEDCLSDLSGQISSILGSITSKLRKKYSWLKSSQIDEIDREIIKAQNAASECTLKLSERPEELADPAEDQSAHFETIVGLESPTPDQRI